MRNRVRRISPPAWMVALLCGATFLRLAAWREAPPGLRFDEMLVSYHADLIRDGARLVYIDDLAEEPLYHYLFAAAQDIIAPHRFTLRSDFTAGTYRLQLGLYQSLTGERLPMVIDGQPVGDQIWLQTVEINKS